MGIATALGAQERYERATSSVLNFPTVNSCAAMCTEARLLPSHASVSQHQYTFPHYKLHIKWVKQTVLPIS